MFTDNALPYFLESALFRNCYWLYYWTLKIFYNFFENPGVFLEFLRISATVTKL